MKLPSFKRLISTDYPAESQKLIEQLGKSLNDGIDQVYFAMANKLTFEENFAATVKEVEVNVGATGIPTTRTSISLSNAEVVKGCLVISAVNKTDAAKYPTSTPFISFTQNGTQLFIDNITSLQANNRYLIKVVAFN